MSTTQCLAKVRQPESIVNLVARIPEKEGQKLSPIKQVLVYWQHGVFEQSERFTSMVKSKFTPTEKVASRLNGTVLHRMLAGSLLYKKVRLALAGIGGSGFSYTTAPYYYTKRIQLRRGFLKVAVCADMNTQSIGAVMTRHDMKHDNPDFLPLPESVNDIIPVGIVLGDTGFDDGNNHAGAEQMGVCSIIPTRRVDVPIYRTGGIHRKEMKRNFPEALCHQRNKSETVLSVIKQIMSGDIPSRNETAQDNEMLSRLIAYNVYRITKLEFAILAWFLQGQHPLI